MPNAEIRPGAHPAVPLPAPPSARARWLAFLATALREVTAAPTVDVALGSMVEMLAGAFEFESVAYLALDRQAGLLRPGHRGGRHGRTPLPPDGMAWPLGQGLPGRAASGARTVVSANVRREGRHPAVFEDTLSEIAVPLVDGDEVLGVLDIQARQRGFFSATAIEVVEAIAAQVVAARRVTLLREAQARRLEEQRAVHEASLDILDARPWEETLGRVVSSARRLLGALGASLALVDRERGDLVVQVVDGLATPPGQRQALGTGINGLVAERGHAVAVPDYQHWEKRLRNPWSETWGSVAAAPLLIDGAVLGVVTVVSDRPDRRFDAGDLRLLTLLAAPAALAVRNAAQTAQRHADLRAVAGVARALSTENDATRIREAIVAAARDALAASNLSLLEPDGEGSLRVTAAGGRRIEAVVPVEDRVSAVARAFRSGRPVFVGDARGSPRALQSLVRKAGARAIYAQPVLRDGVALGVLLAVWDTPSGETTERVRTLLALLATDAAVAIARAHLVERLDGMAHRDALTGAANRRAWDQQLPARLGALRGLGAPACLAMLDLDLFKIYNDLEGHQRGDLLLRDTAAAWTRELLPGDLLARYGGEEFAVLLAGRDLAAAGAVVERLRAAVPEGQTCSAGLAAWDGEESPESLLARADAALYEAKHTGRDRLVVAVDAEALPPPSSGRPGTGWTRWTAVVPRLLDERSVRSAYQPVLRLAGVHWAGGTAHPEPSAVVGYEALARVGPAPTAMASVEGLFAAAQYRGLSRDMDWLCRRSALAGAAAMPPGRALFVNVGVSTLLDPLHDCDQMELLLRWARRAPREVVLEITEREAVRDLAGLRRTVAAYRERGFRFAVDDVGEGHSTLELLAAVTPEFVKVARTLVAAAESPGHRAAIRAVVAFARGCGAEVVAEGIETHVDLERMEDLGVALGQGYGLERPSFAPTGFAPLTATA